MNIQNAPQHIPPTNTSPPLAPDQVTESTSYDSNPASISFEGLSRMFTYAKGVAISMIVLGLLSSVSNFGGGGFDGQDFDSYAEPVGNASQQLNSVDGISTQPFWANVSRVEFSDMALPFLLIVLVLGLIGLVLGAAIGAVYKGVVAAAGNAAAEKRTITIGQAFSQMGQHFGSLFVAELLVGLRILGGLLLFVVPGVRAIFRYQFLPNIILKEGLSPNAAIMRAKQLTQGHLMEMLGISFVAGAVPFIGGVLGAGGNALAYQQIDYVKSNGLAHPKTHWLNYLCLALILLAVIAIILIVVVLVLIAFQDPAF